MQSEGGRWKAYVKPVVTQTTTEQDSVAEIAPVFNPPTPRQANEAIMNAMSYKLNADLSH
jgi:hypothetical protein